jgi:hypothetical protein
MINENASIKLKIRADKVNMVKKVNKDGKIYKVKRADKLEAILLLALVFLFSTIMIMIDSKLNLSYAKEGSVSEPVWYEASIGLARPAVIKTGAAGVLNFTFKPLIAGEFNVKVTCALKSKNIAVKGESVKIIKTAGMKAASAEFEFIALKPADEMFSVEFSMNYPASALAKMIEGKFGSQLIEARKLIKKINSNPEIYAATLPLKIIATDVECAVNPEVYFEKNIDDEFLNIKPAISKEEAASKIESFEAKYDGIFEFNKTEFENFTKRTGCDFLKDLNDYFKGLHAYNYSYGRDYGIDKKTGAALKLPAGEFKFKSPACGYEKIFEFADVYIKLIDGINGNETKNTGTEYYTADGPRIGNISEPLFMAAFYNLYFVESFKNGAGAKEKIAVIKNYESAADLLTGGKYYRSEIIKTALAGYFLYNAGIMYKKTGAIDYKRYFEKAASKNKGLINE